MMSDLTTRILQLACTALDKEKIRYFSAPQKLIAYTPCKVNLKHRTLRPTALRVTISPCDTGILFEASLPVALQVSREEEHRLILRRIAKENYGTIRGGLTYKSETGLLNYRIFYVLSEDAACFDNAEVATCVKLSAASVSDGYESIVNALDESGNDDDCDDSEDTATTESIKAELDALFDRICSSHSETASRPTLEAGDTDSDAGDTDSGDVDVSACSDENAAVDPKLRSMLDDFLSEGTD